MRFTRKEWLAIVAFVKRINITVRFTKRRGERNLYITGADSAWHVALELKLSGRTSTRVDVINTLRDESVVVCVKTLLDQSRTLPNNGGLVNVYIKDGLLHMQTQTSTAVVNYYDKDQVTKDPERLTPEEMRNLIMTGGRSEPEYKGPVTATIIHQRLDKMCSIRVDRREINSLVGTGKDKPLVTIRVAPQGRLSFVTDGSRTDVEQTRFEVGGNEHFTGSYLTSALHLILQGGGGADTRLIIYRQIVTEKETVPSMLGIQYTGWMGVCDVLAVMAPGEARARPPTISTRREVKKRLNDEKEERRIQIENAREAKRRKAIEDVQQAESNLLMGPMGDDDID